MCTELQRADLSYGELHNTKFVSFNICSKIVGKCSDLTADTGDFATDTSMRRRPPHQLWWSYREGLEHSWWSTLKGVVDEFKIELFHKDFTSCC